MDRTQRQQQQAPIAKRSVRGRSLPEALEKVRLLHGPDALVLETRRVLEKVEGELAPRTMFEVVLATGASLAEPVTGAPREDPVRSSLVQLDALTRQVEELSRDVDEELDAEYPLASQLRRAGASEPTLRRLALAFARASDRGPKHLVAARRHLLHWIRALNEKTVDNMAGEHWFLGRAGSGKTTIVLHLAAQLVRAGRKPGLLALAPQHSGEWARLSAASDALGLPAMVAQDAEDLARARDELSDQDVILVDTPCLRLGFPWAQDSPTAQHHLVVPLGDDPLVIRRLLAAPRIPSIDTVAIAQSDLLPRPGKLLDHLGELLRPVSFVAGRDGGRLVVEPAVREDLLAWILGDLADEAPS